MRFSRFFFLTIFAAYTLLQLSSCKEDEGKLPDIAFKTGGSYVSADANLAAGSVVVIGIDAAKTEDKDVLKKFTISKSVNGGATTTVFTKDLTGSEGDNYSYDYNATLGTDVGQVETYTFTVTNRDGLVNQVSLTLTTI